MHLQNYPSITLFDKTFEESCSLFHFWGKEILSVGRHTPLFMGDPLWIAGLAKNSIFSVSFLWKLNDLPRGANKWPLFGATLFSSAPSSNTLVSILDPQRAFWADMAPFSGPRLASCVASGTTEIQGHSQVRWARNNNNNWRKLWCAFVENALFYLDPWFSKFNRIELR